MTTRVDLHTHSNCSDGTDAPERVAERAAARGVSLFALSDHDTCAGDDAARGAFPSALRAVELSCEEGGRTVHILVYDAEHSAAWSELEQPLADLRRARRRRFRAMAERLRQRGLGVDADALLRGAGARPLGRPDLARALVAAGHASSVREAFSRFLADGGGADEPGFGISVGDGLDLARRAGARAALAHPHQHGALAAAIARRYRASGLTGIEAYYASYGALERAKWLELADREGLVPTAGSDYHGPDGAVRIGVDLDDERAARLFEWLGREPRPPEATGAC